VTSTAFPNHEFSWDNAESACHGLNLTGIIGSLPKDLIVYIDWVQ
jgi:hypothetical protein